MAQTKKAKSSAQQRPRMLAIGPRVRVELVREAAPLYDSVISCSQDVYELVHDEVSRWDRERFVTLILDSKNRVIAVEEVSVGSLQASLVHPREVMKAAILANGAAFICVHNHPSGDPKPSTEDERITRRLRDAGELMGIPCLDHVVVGREVFVSMHDGGYW